MSFPRPLSRIVPRLTRQALGKKGAHVATLIEHWDAIVGASLAATCFPESVSFPKGRSGSATVTIRVAGAAAILLQHDEPWILERINNALGYRAVDRLKYFQGPMPLSPPRSRHTVAPPSRDVVQHVETMVSTVQDNELRDALQRLGEAMKVKVPIKTS